MPGAHPDLPRATAITLSKGWLLAALARIDTDDRARGRVLALETEFRRRIATHVESLPLDDALFAKFNTNPFVLLFHATKKGYTHVSQIEEDILPSKLFASMETSAGRMVEAVVLPRFGWECVASAMHTAESVLDGRKPGSNPLRLATLKSGPRCLNDEMSENIADAIVANCVGWAKAAGVTQIDFTYGVLYGTPKQSNKKDWHILRKISEKVPATAIKVSPKKAWTCAFKKGGVRVDVTIRVGKSLWDYIAENDLVFVELACALIRACVSPSSTEPADYQFTIPDLPAIVSLESVPADYNVSTLQRSQLEWLFFFARHFCDRLVEATPEE
ncbi:MAG TPA: hypothetical protein VG013_01400 [Gemmataceae bacterium]|jgi:hypothetical protein|nr:hypothetical protein [Gemmataceae bacterium]HZY89879.1 hypothetical protein [Gemmataceae bacterium]